MNVEDAFNPAVLLLYGVLVTFIVDMIPNAKSWVKVVASMIVSALVVFTTNADAVAVLMNLQSTFWTMLVSSLALAAISSKVLHRIDEKFKGGSRDGGV